MSDKAQKFKDAAEKVENLPPSPPSQPPDEGKSENERGHTNFGKDFDKEK